MRFRLVARGIAAARIACQVRGRTEGFDGAVEGGSVGQFDPLEDAPLGALHPSLRDEGTSTERRQIPEGSDLVKMTVGDVVDDKVDELLGKSRGVAFGSEGQAVRLVLLGGLVVVHQCLKKRASHHTCGGEWRQTSFESPDHRGVRRSRKTLTRRRP